MLNSVSRPKSGFFRYFYVDLREGVVETTKTRNREEIMSLQAEPSF
jgi:hypothetical protein